MSKLIKLNQRNILFLLNRKLSSANPVKLPKESYELVIIGGGSGGLAVASRFQRYFRALKRPPKSIAVIEPKDVHYYQPYWTLVGAGIKDISDSGKPMNEVMPSGVDWIKESCVDIDPQNQVAILSGASGQVHYKYLVVSAGIQIVWDRVEGLTEALERPLETNVCSNYSDKTVINTWKLLQKFEGGHAVFTFPNSPIKCAGAPQKIMYLTDAYLKKKGVRSKTEISYFTSLPAVFGVKHYAKVLMELCNKRQLNVNLRSNLVRVDGQRRLAYFQNLDKPEDTPREVKFDFLHVAPPMKAPDFLKSLANEKSNGFVAVDSKTLQHVQYPNIFSLGDCSSLPTAKTAAAIASQNYILARNLLYYMQKQEIENAKEGQQFFHQPITPIEYNGYSSCPIVTGDEKCIMAEFDYQLEPLETFPIDQSKERRIMYVVKRDILPMMYWNGLIKGYWSGPGIFRKIMRFGF